jgi:transposase
MRPHGSPEVLEHRRERAIKLLGQGLKPVEVAQRLGVDRRSVRRWQASYRGKGEEGIKAQPIPGRPRKLSSKELRQLERKLLAGAKAAGFPNDLWSCPRIALLIFNSFGVRYHVDHISRLLHALGWSPQKPTRRAIERNEAEIQGWIRKDWPGIKKNVRA